MNTTSDIQDCCYPKGITYLIIIHEGDPIPCKTTYIEYRSPSENIHHFFTDCHLIPLVFIAFFLNVLRRRSWGVPFGELEKIFSLMQYKKKLIISGGPVFLLKRSSLGTSDIQTCYSPKGITYIIYTLMYERHQIPFRTTYIEYRSPVNIFINFIGFHCKNMFFCHSSPTPVVGDTLRWAWKTHFFHAI